MALITFLGGDDTGNVGSVRWGRFTFALNLPVECNDPHIVAKASGNRFFKVDGGRVSRPITTAEIKAGKLGASQLLEMTGDLDEWEPTKGFQIQPEIVPDDPADDPDPPPEPEPPVQALSVPEATDPPPAVAKRRGRPPKPKDEAA